MEDITQLVSTLGFPIVMVGFFAWYTVQRDKQEEITNNRHREEIKALSESLNNNTLVMQKLLDKLESEDN